MLALAPVAVLLAGLAAVSLRLGQALTLAEAGLALGVALAWLAAPGLARWRGLAWDPLAAGAAHLLCALGVVVTARVEPELLSRQLIWLLLGWTVLLATLATPHLPDLLRRGKYTWLTAGVLLTVATLIFGRDLNGEGIRLWLVIGPLAVQPSELLKLLLAAFLAGYLEERRDLLTALSLRWGPLRLPPWPYLAPLLAMMGLAMLILVVQHDLGPVLLCYGTFLAMIWAATGRASFLATGLGLFALGGAAGHALSGHIRTRFTLWLDPWSDPHGAGYQSLQSLSGLASGGVAGRGPGGGHPTLIPAAHTDFPLAVIGEEWGLIGTLAVLLLYALLTTRLLSRAARQGQDRFGQLLAAGLAASLGVQAVVILAGTLRLIPLTGVTAPFLSYGGSSMVISFVTLGLALRLGAGGNGPVFPAGDIPLAPGPFSPMLGARGEGRGGATLQALPQRGGRTLARGGRSTAAGRIAQVGAALLAGLALTGGMAAYWQVGRAAELAADPAASSGRLRLDALHATRGRILYRNGDALADNVRGPDGAPARRYANPGAAHVVGYYSERFGAGGMEERGDGLLSGREDQTLARLGDELLGRPHRGADLRLTLDPALQQTAERALGEASGAAVALDVRTGEVLAMVSRPGFDPNRMAEQWESLRQDRGAPLLNRATQGRYRPATRWLPLLRAAAPGLEAAAAFDLPVTEAAVQGAAPGTETAAPLHLALAAAAAANGGIAPAPRLALEEQAGTPRRAMAPERARELLGPLLEAAQQGPPDDRVFIGVGPAGGSSIAVAVVAEDTPDGAGTAGRAGRALLAAGG